HGRHSVKQRANNEQDYPFGPLQKSDFTSRNNVFGTRARVTDHDGSRHHDSSQNHVRRPVNSAVVDQQPNEQRDIRITIENGIEEPAKSRDLIGGASDASIHHIEKTGENNNKAGGAE